MSILCSMVGASFVTAVAEVIRRKLGITAVGNAQVDTAQSKFGGSSALFDGTGDYLIVQSNPLPTSGDFTVELWIRFSSFGVLRPIWSNRDTGGTNRGVLYVNSTGGITWWNGGDNLNFGSNLSTNTWYHIACVKDGSTRRLLVDGAGMVTDSGAYTAGDLFQIGRADYTSTAFTSEIAGHIDEIRVSNSARYTTTFTPSTTAFVNDANTVLLIHANGTDAQTFFDDDNGVRAPKGISALGNAQVDTAQSKFGGASALFDGTGDYLDVALTNTFTGDFTIEYFMRMSTTVDFQAMFILGSAGTDGTEIFYRNSDQKLVFDVWNKFSITSSSTVTTNTWYHIAASRIGSALTMYINGTSVASTTYTGSIGNGGTLNIGRRSDNIWYWNGHIDEFRISDTARYTANFTAPTQPFVNDANTLLLIHGDGTDASTVFRDDNGVRASIGITGVNQAQISTAQSKFGGSSIVFDGTDDHLTVATFPTTTGDLTWELWGRFDILPWNQTIGGGNFMQIAYTGGGDYLIINRSGSSGSQVLLQVATGNRYGSFTKSGVNLAIDTWYHIAFVRTSGVWKAFFNGTELTTFINDSNFTNSGRTENVAYTQIGKFGDSRGSWDGYMDEIRFSNSARYTADFTPSTTPFQNDANTLLLMHCDGSNSSTVFFDDNGRDTTP